MLVRAWDAAWPERFEAERQRLAAVLGDAVDVIEHVGSTSIVGLAAKPVIDILVGTACLTALDSRNSAMRAAGYEVRGENGLPGRRYFRRAAADGTRLAHIHAYLVGSDGFHRHLVFRDYLRAHPDEVTRYGEHKRALADGMGLKRQDYQSAKAAMVAQIEARALVWAAR